MWPLLWVGRRRSHARDYRSPEVRLSQAITEPLSIAQNLWLRNITAADKEKPRRGSPPGLAFPNALPMNGERPCTRL